MSKYWTNIYIHIVVLIQTYETHVEEGLAVCEKHEFRVASVNQYGTHGFAPSVPRSGMDVFFTFFCIFYQIKVAE